MLSNIASIEISPLEETLFDWLSRQPAERLAKLHVKPDEIDDRTFYPRVALGEYFHDQLQAMLLRADRAGWKVIVHTRCEVLAAVSSPGGMTLAIQPRKGPLFQQSFDRVVLATGH